MEIIFSISGQFFRITCILMLMRNHWAVWLVHNHTVHKIYTHREWDNYLMVLCTEKLGINTGLIRLDQTTFQPVKTC